LIAAINARDFDLLDELVATDVVRHNQATAGVEVRSLEQFKEFLEQDLSKFPDAQQEIYTIIAEEEKVALYLTLTGTQEGPVRPYPATGRRVEVKFLGIMRLENA
jgi:predicted ester cyclase